MVRVGQSRPWLCGSVAAEHRGESVPSERHDELAAVVTLDLDPADFGAVVDGDELPLSADDVGPEDCVVVESAAGGEDLTGLDGVVHDSIRSVSRRLDCLRRAPP